MGEQMTMPIALTRVRRAPSLGARRRSRSAFTFIEVLIGVTILIIGFLGLYASLNASAHLSEAAKETNIAMFKLQTTMEYLFSIPFDDVTTTLSADAPIDIVALADSTMGNDFRLSSEQVTIVYEDPQPDFLKFTITINWSSRTQTPRSASISSGRMR